MSNSEKPSIKMVSAISEPQLCEPVVFPAPCINEKFETDPEIVLETIISNSKFLGSGSSIYNVNY